LTLRSQQSTRLDRTLPARSSSCRRPGSVTLHGAGSRARRSCTYLVCGRCSQGSPCHPATSPQVKAHKDTAPASVGRPSPLRRSRRSTSHAAGQERQARCSQHRIRPPLRNRTVDLLLTIYPRPDAVAICDDAAQVRGGARCCGPTYLLIKPGPAARTPRPLAGALAAVPPTHGHAVQPPPRGGAAMAGRPGTALLAPAAARARTARQGSRSRAAAGWLTCPPSAWPASAARTPSAGKPAQRTTAHRQHRTLPPDPAPHATRPGPGTRRDLPGSTGSAENSAYSKRMVMRASPCSYVISAISPAVANEERPTPWSVPWDVQKTPCRVCAAGGVRSSTSGGVQNGRFDRLAAAGLCRFGVAWVLSGPGEGCDVQG